VFLPWVSTNLPFLKVININSPKSMPDLKILVIDAIYPEHLANFYAVDVYRKTAPYKDQLEGLTRSSGVLAAWWLVNELNLISKAVAIPVIANARELQKKWAEETGFEATEEDWLHEILLKQIDATRPDIIVVFPLGLLRQGFLQSVRVTCPGIRAIIGWDGAGLHNIERVRGCDAVLSCLEHTTALYRGWGMIAHTLVTGFDVGLWKELYSCEKRYDTVFVGSVRGADFDLSRFCFLLELKRRRDIQLWMGNYPGWKPWDRMQLGLLRRGKWRKFLEIWELGRQNLGTRFGKEMYRILGESRICLNQHVDFGSGQSAGNRRLWEATGMGACLLTDWQPNLSNIFEIDREVVTYRSLEECVEKIDYLLAHENERAAIAQAGMKRTHRDYSCDRFANELLEIVSKIYVQ
jgi:hypothetical protein